VRPAPNGGKDDILTISDIRPNVGDRQGDVIAATG
jgi:hypothetical protein